MSWTLREHQREPDRLAHLLYWQQLIEDDEEDAVWQNDNSLLSVLRYRGPDMESADAHELMALTARRHGVMMTLDAGWAVQCEARRHMAALLWEHIPEGHAQTDAVTSFREEVLRVTQQLAGIFTEVELLRGDALVTYLKSTVSENHQAYVAVPEPPWYLNYQLTDTPLYPGVTPRLGEQWLRMILVKNEHQQVGFPETTYPGILDVLHDL